MGKKDPKLFPYKKKDVDFLTLPPSGEVRKKINKIHDFSNKFRFDFHSEEDISVLHFAAVRGHPETLCYLLTRPEVDSKIDDCTESGKSPLHLAVKYENLKTTEALIGKCAKINEPENSNGYTPLHYACKANNLGEVKLLIENGADPSCRDNSSTTGRKPAILTQKETIKRYIREHLERLAEKQKREKMDAENARTERRVDKLEQKMEKLVKVVTGMRKAGSQEMLSIKPQHQRFSMASEDSGVEIDPDLYPDLSFMDQKRRRIQKEFHNLLEYMNNPVKIATILYTKKMIDTNTRQQIERQATCHDKNTMILDLILQGNPDMYGTFLMALQQTHQYDIIRLLQETDHLPNHPTPKLSPQAMDVHVFQGQSDLARQPYSGVVYPQQHLTSLWQYDPSHMKTSQRVYSHPDLSNAVHVGYPQSRYQHHHPIEHQVHRTLYQPEQPSYHSNQAFESKSRPGRHPKVQRHGQSNVQHQEDQRYWLQQAQGCGMASKGNDVLSSKPPRHH